MAFGRFIESSFTSMYDFSFLYYKKKKKVKESIHLHYPKLRTSL